MALNKTNIKGINQLPILVFLTLLTSCSSPQDANGESKSATPQPTEMESENSEYLSDASYNTESNNNEYISEVGYTYEDPLEDLENVEKNISASELYIAYKYKKEGNPDPLIGQRIRVYGATGSSNDIVKKGFLNIITSGGPLDSRPKYIHARGDNDFISYAASLSGKTQPVDLICTVAGEKFNAPQLEKCRKTPGISEDFEVSDSYELLDGDVLGTWMDETYNVKRTVYKKDGKTYMRTSDTDDSFEDELFQATKSEVGIKLQNEDREYDKDDYYIINESGYLEFWPKGYNHYSMMPIS